MHILTEGIVLREKQIEENDSILTLLTHERGVVSAYARGARKPRCNWRAGVELLSCSEFVLFCNRDRYSLDKTDLHRLFMGVRSDIVQLSLASYFCQLTAEIAPHEEAAPEYLRLLLNCLHLLDRKKRSCEVIKPLYELRLLTMAGYMPDLLGCKSCGTFSADEMYFLPQHSMLLCGNCRQQENAALHIPLGQGVLAAMRHILYSDIDKLFNFTLANPSLLQLGEIVQLYVTTQIEKRFETLDFYESVR